MNLKDQLQNLFPDHEIEEDNSDKIDDKPQLDIWLQEDPLLCKYEKRNGKPNTIIDNYNGAKKDFKTLTKHLQKECGVGGSYKNESIIIQGDFRDKIMQILTDLGFNVKRVGG